MADRACVAASVMDRDLYSFPPLGSAPAPIPAARVVAFVRRTDAIAQDALEQLHGVS
jgi:hypothetical protein